MSWWTYATGWIRVLVPGRTQAEKDYIIKTVLNHLPIVKGSEEEMYIHTFAASGHDECDCQDEYGMRTNNLKHWNYGFKDQRHGVMELQNHYYIFVEGNFRDTYYKEQYRQLIKWITRLSKRLCVEEVDISFSDGFNCSCRITNDFWDCHDSDDNWCDHLFWRDNPYEKRG